MSIKRYGTGGGIGTGGQKLPFAKATEWLAVCLGADPDDRWRSGRGRHYRAVARSTTV